MKHYDLTIIGGGPGGYTVAQRVAAEGRRVLLVEEGELGGTCLNRGCIPTKALLHVAKTYAAAQKAEALGIHIDGLRLDWEAALAHKNHTVETLRRGVQYQMDRYDVTVQHDRAQVLDARHVRVGEDVLRTEALVIATGAHFAPSTLPGADLPHVLDSNALLNLERLPEHLVICGADALGLGFAAIFANLGVAISLLDPQPTLLPDMDAELVKLLQDSLHHMGMKLYQNAHVTSITPKTVEFQQGDSAYRLKADAVLLLTPRRPNVFGLGLEAAAIDFDEGGLRVNRQMQSNVPRVYAVGDVTGQRLYAHAALRMADVAAASLLGRRASFHLDSVPRVIYSDPEAAALGLTVPEAQARGFHVKVARLPMSANGRHVAQAPKTPGLLKLVIDAERDVILGVHMVAPNAAEFMLGAAALLGQEFRLNDLRDLAFAHPTVSEAFKDVSYEVR